ncbi:uncharacterized protein ACBR49_012919 isoform 2-T3 [Aulostomus maculatus]
MAEEEINYASVVFKTNKQPAPVPAKTEEATVYSDVKERNQHQSDINGFSSDKKGYSRHKYQQLGFWLAIICIILLLGVTGILSYFSFRNPHQSELETLKDSQTNLLMVLHNLTDISKNLSSDNEYLRATINNLEGNLGNLTKQIQQLEEEKNNLTGKIQDMEAKQLELNLTQAQWSIDAYCPRVSEARKCSACEEGWYHFQSSCYVIINEPPARKTWAAAREECRGRSSDLAVITDEGMKRNISNNSWKSEGTSGYWIGLSVQSGKWMWVNGSELTESSWIEKTHASDQCAISVENDGLKAVSCDAENRWICGKKALSV